MKTYEKLLEKCEKEWKEAQEEQDRKGWEIRGEEDE